MELLEYEECILLTDYLNLLQTLHKIVRYTHIPNSTYTTSWNQKRKNKRLGVNAGFPDYIILTKNEVFCLEMKRKKGGVVSQEQHEWLVALNNIGIKSYVAKGFEQAKGIIETFL